MAHLIFIANNSEHASFHVGMMISCFVSSFFFGAMAGSFPLCIMGYVRLNLHAELDDDPIQKVAFAAGLNLAYAYLTVFAIIGAVVALHAGADVWGEVYWTAVGCMGCMYIISLLHILILRGRGTLNPIVSQKDDGTNLTEIRTDIREVEELKPDDLIVTIHDPSVS